MPDFELLVKACAPWSLVNQSCYKPGDVVEIRQVPHRGWGKEELNKKKFCIITVRDCSFEDLADLLQPGADQRRRLCINPKGLGHKIVTLEELKRQWQLK